MSRLKCRQMTGVEDVLARSPRSNLDRDHAERVMHHILSSFLLHKRHLFTEHFNQGIKIMAVTEYLSPGLGLHSEFDRIPHSTGPC